MSVAQRLVPLGLRNTLIVVRHGEDYRVSRIRSLGENVELTTQGTFRSEHVPHIGRVGIADPALGVPWKNSMPFYGKWFDNVGETDPGYRLRKNISSLSHRSQLEQISRDDQYALVGSYYSVFKTIMEVKRRVPLVLIDDTLVPLNSFPVVLPRIADAELEEKLIAVLGFMLRPDRSADSPKRDDPLGLNGIEVDES